MVKSDVHMERVRTRLVDEASGIKKSEAAKKQRDLKKYGKQIQHEKLKSRIQERKGMDERIRGIKRKRKDGVEVGDEGEGQSAFDVRVEDAIEGRGESAGRRGGKTAGGRGGRDTKVSPWQHGCRQWRACCLKLTLTQMPRHARNAKFGMGGGGRRSKENTRESTNDFGPSAGRGKPSGRGGARGGARGGGQRPGKSRRDKGRK
jgi:rRNA-processing protein EBP2